MKYLISNNLELFNTTNTSVEEAISKLKELNEVCVDSETTGLDAHLDKLVLLQLGNKEDQYIFDIVSFNFIIPNSLKLYLNESNQLFIFQNAKFDLKFLLKNNIIITKVYDTLLAETILTNGLQYGGRGLSDLCKKYLGFELDKTLQKKITVNITSDVVEYAAKDIMVLSEIKKRQLIEIENLELSKALELDNNFVPVLAYVEFCGLKLDVNKWKDIDLRNRGVYKECKNSLENILINDKKLKYFSGMYDMFDNTLTCEINWNSPKQVIEVFNSYGIKTTKIEKGKKISSVESDILEPQKNDFDIIIPYLKLKEVKKKISTYGLNWINIINPSTGRIHTMFKQLMVTGRLSSGDKETKSPNFQNIPSDKETRSCFICEKGNKLIAADYSSQEQIVLANFSKEENLINFYKKGFTDMHSYVAFLMYPIIRRCSVEELTPDKLLYIKEEYKEKRTIAKNAGFAIKTILFNKKIK
jgi:DNA polymerase I